MKKLRKPHIHNRKFYNHEKDTSHSGFFVRTFKMLLQYYALLKKQPQKNQSCWVEPICPCLCSSEPLVTWLGHASFLVQVGGINILLDPIFGDVSFLYKRILPTAFSVNRMPKIDFIVISHNHRDHMDASSLLAIKKQNPDVIILVPQGDKAWFDNHYFSKVFEHNWWEQRSFAAVAEKQQEITFSFLPAAHWSRRGFFDKNKSLWGSWMIECAGNKIYFAGDTSYSTHFKEIAQEFNSIDIALLPVGPSEPRELLESWHIGEHEAGKAFLELGARHFIPMHWGTFPFGVEHFDAPIISLKIWWKKNKARLKGMALHCAKIGKVVSFKS
ncbi:MBL fold metallo-hydrolase [bacterium]|nr:MBL fold metallo-hydrolase [bacterium]